MKKFKVVILEENQLKPNHLKPVQTFNVSANSVAQLFEKCYQMTNFQEVVPFATIPNIPPLSPKQSNVNGLVDSSKHSPVIVTDNQKEK